jgi:hypothetical protein
MEKKITIDLDDLRVETFTPRQWVRSGARGTVYAHDHTYGHDPCTAGPLGDITCAPANTCHATCGESCEPTCDPECNTNLGCPTVQTACTWAEPCTAFETCDGSCEETCGPTGQPPECTDEECTECEIGECTDGECCPWNFGG